MSSARIPPRVGAGGGSDFGGNSVGQSNGTPAQNRTASNWCLEKEEKEAPIWARQSRKHANQHGAAFFLLLIFHRRPGHTVWRRWQRCSWQRAKKSGPKRCRSHCTSRAGDPLPNPTRRATSATADLRACSREWATPSDRKRQSAPSTHGDHVERGTRHVGREDAPLLALSAQLVGVRCSGAIPCVTGGGSSATRMPPQ